jgi:hypothetical protein
VPEETVDEGYQVHQLLTLITPTNEEVSCPLVKQSTHNQTTHQGLSCTVDMAGISGTLITTS